MNSHFAAGLNLKITRLFRSKHYFGLVVTAILVFFGLLLMSQRVFAAISVLNLFGIPGNQSITLQWETAAEFNLSGFNLFRSTNPNANFSIINAQLITAKGDAFIGDIYTYTDQPLTNGQIYYYRLQIVRADNSVEEYGPLQVAPGSTATVVAPITPTIFAVTPTVQSTQATQAVTGTAVSTATGTTLAGSTQLPTITAAPSDTPVPLLTSTPTLGSISIDTITPVTVIDTSATETAIAIAFASDVARITPQITSIPESQAPTSRDWIRIGILVVVGAIWILLGVWMYYYLSRLTK